MSGIVVDCLEYSANIKGQRLASFACTYPRFIHEQVLTHRMLSRNSASARAVPAYKYRERTLARPSIPVRIGKNQKGMHAEHEVEDVEGARQWWLDGLKLMAEHHARGEARGYHKEIVNRMLDLWTPMTVIISATELDNFFVLRMGHDAQPEIQELARKMKSALDNAQPKKLYPGHWHLPLVERDDKDSMLYVGLQEALDIMHEGSFPNVDHVFAAISAARCARVSYLTHNGQRDLSEDIRLYRDLVTNRHMSPLEHPAVALADERWYGNFSGFKQLRKMQIGESYGRTPC